MCLRCMVAEGGGQYLRTTTGLMSSAKVCGDTLSHHSAMYCHAGLGKGRCEAWVLDWQLFFDFFKSNSDTPSKFEVSGKNESCNVSIKLIKIFTTASSPLKFSMTGIEVSIVL